jgi:hypothetical protein
MTYRPELHLIHGEVANFTDLLIMQENLQEHLPVLKYQRSFP